MKKRIISVLLTIILSLSLATSFSVTALADVTVFSQRDSRWGNYSYGKGDTGLANDKATIGTSGCMLLSLTNAVYFLNESFLEPTILADFAIAKGCRKNYSGTADCFVKHAAEKYGSTYGFEYVGNVTTESKLKSALQNGQVAVWHTDGHIMSIVDYDSSKNKYLVLNSEVKTKTKKASAWITYSQIQSYKTVGLCFMLIKNTKSSNNEPVKTVINWPSTKNIKTYVKSTGNNTIVYKTATSTEKYGTIYASDLITINGYSGNRLKVTYPISGGTKTGYIAVSDVTSGTVNQAISKWKATSKITTYRRSGGGATLGYISKGDVCYTIATSGNWKQVIYPISDGWKMGWINK